MKHPHSRCELGIPALEIASELDASVLTVESPHQSRAPEARPERTHAAGALGIRAPPWPARARLSFLNRNCMLARIPGSRVHRAVPDARPVLANRVGALSS